MGGVWQSPPSNGASEAALLRRQLLSATGDTLEPHLEHTGFLLPTRPSQSQFSHRASK
jgi:hypothetical protein